MRWRHFEKERRRKRALESAKFSYEMRVQHGAPDDCALVPFDCVMLRQSIMAHGNEVPPWIMSASNAWLASRGLTGRALRPGP